MSLDLVPLWAVILAVAVLMYVLLDGFDLGVGILFLFRKPQEDRDLMVASVAPIWEIPVGRGKHWGRSMPKVADAIAGGWQLTGVFGIQSKVFSANLTSSGPAFIRPAIGKVLSSASCAASTLVGCSVPIGKGVRPSVGVNSTS